MINNITILKAMRMERQTAVALLRKEISKPTQDKAPLKEMVAVCEFYTQEIAEIDEKIKKRQEELQKSLEEAKIRAEQEKRKHYIQKGGGVKIIYLSRQERETIQKIAESLGIEHLEEVGENEDGTEASPSWWGDTTF